MSTVWGMCSSASASIFARASRSRSARASALSLAAWALAAFVGGFVGVLAGRGVGRGLGRRVGRGLGAPALENLGALGRPVSPSRRNARSSVAAAVMPSTHAPTASAPKSPPRKALAPRSGGLDDAARGRFAASAFRDRAVGAAPKSACSASASAAAP